MRRIGLTAVAIIVAGLAAAWWLSAASRLAEGELPGHTPDLANGEQVFWAGGCASCHASPVDGKRAKGSDKLLLGGGMDRTS